MSALDTIVALLSNRLVIKANLWQNETYDAAHLNGAGRKDSPARDSVIIIIIIINKKQNNSELKSITPLCQRSHLSKTYYRRTLMDTRSPSEVWEHKQPSRLPL